MTVYVIAQLRFTDRAAYDRYQIRFMPARTLWCCWRKDWRDRPAAA